MQLSHVTIYAFFTLSILCLTEADLFDELVDGLHEKIVKGADFLKHVAAPTARKKFTETRETLRELKTEDIREWITETAVPTVNEQVNNLVDFIKENLTPQLEKIKNAYYKLSTNETVEESDQFSINGTDGTMDESEKLLINGTMKEMIRWPKNETNGNSTKEE